MTGFLSSTLLMALVAAQAPADVRLLPVRGVGLESETLELARSLAAAEVKKMGFSIEIVAKAPEASCLDDASCAATLSADSAGVLEIELVRFGPDIIMTSRFFDRSGEQKASAETAVTPESLPASENLLGPDFKMAIGEAVDAQPDPLLDVDPPVSDAGEQGSTASATGKSENAEPNAEAADQATQGDVQALELPVTALATAAIGGGITVFGALLSAAGIGMTSYALSVLFDASSPGEQKASMEPVRFVGLLLGSAGVLVLCGGLAVVAGGGVAFVATE